MSMLPTADATPMSWIQLGGLFCIEFGSGTLGALAFVPPAPVGPPFYRLLSAMAAIPLALGLWLLRSENITDVASTLFICGALFALPFFAVPNKGKLRWFALGSAILCGSAAVFWNLIKTSDAGAGLTGVAAVSALASGLLVGSIGVAMTLGHAYLTYPNLKINHLVRVNRLTAAIILIKSALVALVIFGFARNYEPLSRAVGTTGGQFGLFTRCAAGLALPLLFAWMVESSLRYQNTRSATGILYASTVLVLIGEALAMSLRGQAGGVPI
ncbi:MAG: hypothetical protein HY286_19615 [Planctomycetes bacterium]|nr:hypothetical protein [Planctomycetota bacterium]